MYHQAAWDPFREDCMVELNDKIIDVDQPLASYDRFAERPLAVAQRHIPVNNKTDRVKVKKVPYWSTECAEAISARNKVKTLMVRTRLLDDALEYRGLKERVQSIIKSAKHCSWQKYCSTLNEKLQVKKV